jgi:hypothetical protein
MKSIPLLLLALLLSPAAIADESPNAAQTHPEKIRYLPRIQLVGDAQGSGERPARMGRNFW